MKFMLNGAPTLGTMDGANVEIVEEVGRQNAFIFGLSSDEVINFEQNGGYDPREIYNNDPQIRRVVDQLVDGTYAHGNTGNVPGSLQFSPKRGKRKPPGYVFYPEGFPRLRQCPGAGEEAYRDRDRWARMALLQTASCGKFSSDRTIQEYVDDIWHLERSQWR